MNILPEGRYTEAVLSLNPCDAPFPCQTMANTDKMIRKIPLPGVSRGQSNTVIGGITGTNPGNYRDDPNNRFHK